MHITYVSNFLGPVTRDWQWACDVVRGVTGVARPPIGRGDVTWPAARLWLAEDRGDTGGDHHLGRGMHELCWAQRDSHDTRDTLSFSSSSTVASSQQWPDQILPDSGSRGWSWCSWCYRPRHRPSSLVTTTNNLIIHTTTTLATLSTSEDDNSKLMQYILYLHFFTAPMCASLVLKNYTTRLFFYQENCPNNK